MPDSKFLKISVVTPSFNQAQFLESTIISALSQNYPNLEYIIIDGGSTDGSLDIIRKYSDKLTYWVSEPDKGRGDAINKGFKHSAGEIMAWLGCGDMYCPWAFGVVNEIFAALPEVEWLTTGSPLTWNLKGQVASCGFRFGYSRQGFVNGCYLPKMATLQQESTFWRRPLWERAGGYIDENFPVVPDFELWARFWKYASVYTTSVPLGGIRTHSGQEISHRIGLSVGKKVLLEYYGKHSGKFYQILFEKLLLCRILLSYLRKHRMHLVEYNFDTEKWFTRRARARLFKTILGGIS